MTDSHMQQEMTSIFASLISGSSCCGSQLQQRTNATQEPGRLCAQTPSGLKADWGCIQLTYHVFLVQRKASMGLLHPTQHGIVTRLP